MHDRVTEAFDDRSEFKRGTDVAVFDSYHFVPMCVCVCETFVPGRRRFVLTSCFNLAQNPATLNLWGAGSKPWQVCAAWATQAAPTVGLSVLRDGDMFVWLWGVDGWASLGNWSIILAGHEG